MMSVAATWEYGRVVKDVRELLGVAGDAVHVVARTADGTGGELLESLAGMADWLTVVPARCAREPCPRLVVSGTRAHGEITFVGAVEGRQVEPLVLLLHELATGSVSWETPATPQLLGEIGRNVAVSVFVSPSCVYCPAVASTVLRFAQANARIGVAIVRADRVPPPDGVRAVPAVAADGRVVATGAIAEYELAERVAAAAISGRRSAST